MCEKCRSLSHPDASDTDTDPIRRKIILGGSAISAAAALAPSFVSFSSMAQNSASAPNMAARNVQAWGTNGPQAPFQSISIPRRAVGPLDVSIEILYAGICHSDIHTVHGDWGAPQYPCVPGHEIVGRVIAVGDQVTRFKVGDIGGVGCMVDSCGECANCLADREQNCLNGTTFTYGSADKISGGYTFGGYAKNIVVREHFVVNVPSSMELSRVAPIMCAGITTFSPMQHWALKPGQHVGVVGIGGLGHMAVKLALAHGAKVTALTTSPNKFAAIKAMGAQPVLWTDNNALRNLYGSMDLMISTIPYPFSMQPLLNLMKLDATFVNVGQLGTLDGLSGMMMGFNRQSLAGSMIGGMKETQEVINYCAEHNILPDVEIIKPHEIDEAWRRVQDKDIQFRFVIDMQA